MSVLVQYELRFSKNDSNINIPYSNNRTLSFFMSDLDNIEELEAFIHALESLINNEPNSEIDGLTMSYLKVNVSNTEASFYEDSDAYFEDNSITPDYVLPTVDLKEILEAWRDYLES